MRKQKPVIPDKRIRWTHSEVDALLTGRKWLTDTSQDKDEQIRRWKLAQEAVLPEDRRRSDTQLQHLLSGEAGKTTVANFWKGAIERNPSIATRKQLPHTTTQEEKDQDVLMASRYVNSSPPPNGRPEGVGRARHGADLDDELLERDRKAAIFKVAKRVSNYRYRTKRYIREHGKPSPVLEEEYKRAQAKLTMLQQLPLAKPNEEVLAQAVQAAQRLPTGKPKRIRWTDDDMRRIAYDDEVRLTVQHYDMAYSLARLTVAIGEAQIRQLRPELRKDEEALYSLVRRRTVIKKLRAFLAENRRPKAVRPTATERIGLIEGSLKAIGRHQAMLEPYAAQVHDMRIKGGHWEAMWSHLEDALAGTTVVAATNAPAPAAEGETVTARKLRIVNIGTAASEPPKPAQPIVAPQLGMPAVTTQATPITPITTPITAPYATPAPGLSLGAHIGNIIDQSIAATVAGIAAGMQQAMGAQIEALQLGMAKQFEEALNARLATVQGSIVEAVAKHIGASPKLAEIKAMLIDVVGGPTATAEPEDKPQAEPIEVQPARQPKVAIFGLHGNNATLVRNEMGEVFDLRFYDIDHLNDMPRDGTPAVLATKFIPHTLRYKLQGMGCPLTFAQGGAGSVIAALRTMAQQRNTTVMNGAMQ